MPLADGQALSFYEILGPLGAGGMGEVYLARDTRLEREVAIKVLPEELADDEERLRRFEREAKTLASLNHTNVAGIHGIDQVDGTCFIAMELVPGEDLAERLAHGALPVRDALDVCRQIAEGLEAAHEAGVVHRDLKPANVRITPEGVVKVLDFGLAKPTGPNTAYGSGTSVTAKPDSFLVTEEGKVLGTPTYMSPEQARGRPVDRRTDIWAFGCVLYECLTGKRAFGGESFPDVLAAIVSRDPDWSQLPALPARVEELLRRTLKRDPRSRLRDIGEARVLLESPGDLEALERKAPLPLVPAALLFLAGVLVTALAFLAFRGPTAGSGPARFSVHIAPEELLYSSSTFNLALSRDASTLAWIGGVEHKLFVRALDSFETRALPETEGAVSPFFSPDGEWIGFYRDDELLKIRLDGGKPVQVARPGGGSLFFRGASWGDDGWIVFCPNTETGVLRVRESGGEVEQVTVLDREAGVRTHRWPYVLPGAEVLLYTSDDETSIEYYDDAAIVAHSLVTGEERVVVQGAMCAAYAAGHLVFVRADGLYTQRFDPDSLTTSGPATLVLSDLEADSSTGSAQFALADDGTLMHAPGVNRERQIQLAWRDADGESSLLDVPPGSYMTIHISPSGSRVLLGVAGTASEEVWLHDIERGATSRLSSQGQAPIWSSDGSQVFFGRKADLFTLRIDSGDEPQRIASGSEGSFYPVCFVPRENIVIGTINLPGGTWDLIGVDVEKGEVVDRFGAQGGGADIHPDGEWLVTVSPRTGREEVYLTRMSDSSVLIPVSSEGGVDPHWSADGGTIYFIRYRTRELWAVDVEVEASAGPGSSPTIGPSRLVLPKIYFQDDDANAYDVAPDGRILTKFDPSEREVGRELRVQRGWVGEVTRGESR